MEHGKIQLGFRKNERDERELRKRLAQKQQEIRVF